ncbi:hypothetical protein SAMN04488109_0094 [Chryseolinea serpens]|uniref:Uncharacterized protein n=1 Tax=Chryseolinea serpens TaxID=947013 RepID=A0A1M5JK04_9BACT|nr:hypothetical protein [Chryseolinea serpens]SHG40579.1 hypothetical protein SAMN04488109_0094 [Chryseolinea serpens]
MGEISIVSGIILVRDVRSFETAIENMDADENHPWIRPEMFNLGSTESPYFYEYPIASFAATYKNVEGGTALSEFVLKFEYLLETIDFDFVRIRLDTEFLRDFEFFWGRKSGEEREFFKREDLIECEKWFFGYGFRHMFGGLMSEAQPDVPYDFVYPVKFDDTIKDGFNEMVFELNQIPLAETIYVKDFFKRSVLGHDHAHLILTYLKLNKVIKFGFESGRGLYIERLKEIKELDTPYNKYG